MKPFFLQQLIFSNKNYLPFSRFLEEEVNKLTILLILEDIALYSLHSIACKAVKLVLQIVL
jgi:hypothetical protein